jgi:Xaa-Pro aminopeptidase
MNQESIEKFRQWLAAQELDAFLISQPQNRSYLSGWLNDDIEGSGVLLVSQEHLLLLTNPLYAEVAAKEAEGWEVLVPASRQYIPAIVTQAQKSAWQKIGFESSVVTFAEYDKIRTAGEGIFTLHPYEQSYVEHLRQVKQPYEIAHLRRAIAITDETFAHVCRWIQPGMTEKEVQWEIARKMVELGADAPAFETIVASGPNGTMPHAHASERPIQTGELITIDMGARYKGYCADMTRTICLGEPNEPRAREVFEAVLHAMKTCEAGLSAHVSGHTGDALARNSLDMVGLAEYYVHSTGHGVGLQIHEGPNLSPRSPEDLLLPVGAVVTVEPGVYIPGWSGARMEDCVLVQENGIEILTQSPTELVIPR